MYDDCGNYDSTELTISVFPVPEVNIVADKYKGCSPLQASFKAENSHNLTDIYWRFDVLDVENVSLARYPTHIFYNDGYYDIEFRGVTINGCKVRLLEEDLIQVYPVPEADFIPDPQIVEIYDPAVHFDNYSSDANTYYWDFDDGDVSGLFAPTHYFYRKGLYNISLIATNNFGCTDTAFSQIEVKGEHTFYTPTAITCDDDNKNEGFKVYATGVSTEDFLLQIYDRWGEPIYSSDNLYGIWFGKVKNGSKSPVGTYTWVCSYKTYTGVGYTKSGSITILR